MNYPIDISKKAPEKNRDDLLQYAEQLEAYIDWRRQRVSELTDSEVAPGEYKAEFVRQSDEIHSLRNDLERRKVDYADWYECINERLQLKNLSESQAWQIQKLEKQIEASRKETWQQQKVATARKPKPKPKPKLRRSVQNAVVRKIAEVESHML